MRNACLTLVVFGYPILVATLSLCRLWAAVVPLLILAGLAEVVCREAIGPRLDAKEMRP
jgi:hypothetical protein